MQFYNILSILSFGISGAVLITLPFLCYSQFSNGLNGITEIEKKIIENDQEKEDKFNLGKESNWKIIFGENKFILSWLLPYVNDLPKYSEAIIKSESKRK